MTRNQLLYHMTNHKTKKSGVICMGYTTNIVSTLSCQATRDFCFYYLAAFASKRLRIPWVANDYEVIVNRASNSVDMYRRKTPFKVKTELDYSDLDHIATLSFQLLPTDSEYQSNAIEIYNENKV